MQLGEHVNNPLDSIWGTIISGVILAFVLVWIARLIIG
jgi:hypothetical protein